MQRKIKKTRIWIKIAAIFAAALIISATVIGIIYMMRGNSSAPHFDINVTAPGITQFTDDQTVEIGANAIPAPNNNRQIAAPDDLIISYNHVSGDYGPAIRMEISDDDIAKNIKITPAAPGTWSRRGQNMIVFHPDHQWPADTTFNVRINPAIISDDALVNSTRATFTTPQIAASIDMFNTYPVADKSVVGVAVISFNYPVDTKNFDDRVILRLDGESIDFTTKFDNFHRTAIITSAPIKITDDAQMLRLKINRVPSATTDNMTKKITGATTIAAADNIFKITSMDTTTADDKSGAPQQLLLIDVTAAAATDTKWSDYINVYMLPIQQDDKSDDETAHVWQNDEITTDVLNRATKIDITPVEFENPIGVYRYAFSYDVPGPAPRYIYVAVKPGILSSGGFVMHGGIERVMPAPFPQRSVKIAGSGALLALGGDRKLGIVARGGVDTAYINLYKVKSDEINHLISQTYNVFDTLEFKSWSFNTYDMSSVFKKKIGFSDTSMKRVNYASVDLGDYLDRTHNDKTGIFIVQAAADENRVDYADQRLILLTNMGIVRKVNWDNSSSVFVANLNNGTPADDATVSVLGRNGNAIWSGVTTTGGRADIPNFPWAEYRNEREPVAIVARRGDDVSFIPYENAYAQRVEYSKYNVDGVYTTDKSAMNAFLFTDRGIYRPGENMIIGGIIKSRTFKPLAGVPVRIDIRDARGRVRLEKTFSLTSDGLFDIKYDIPAGAPIGEYIIHAYSLNAKGKNIDMLGYANFRVAEFTPDTMKITAHMAGATDSGWMTPGKISINTTVRNMFGTPATNRDVTARIIMTPAVFEFPAYREYNFTSNFISGTGVSANMAAQPINREIADIKTNDDGIANIEFDTTDWVNADVTYNMNIVVSAMDAGAGRGVQTAIGARMSGAKYLIGWRANGDLTYINRDTARRVNFIAVDHTGTATTAKDVTVRLIRRENLTSLVKDNNDYYKYQTVTRDKIISQNTATITDSGMDIDIDTTTPGTYFLQIINSADKIMANIEYFVAGDENIEMKSDTQAQLQIKLNAAEYAPGDDIAVSITAPYAGYGLITIERDRVYAYKWFNTTTTNSVQHITVPDKFDGTGYINVSFVRDINSRDIFTSPYAYAVAPFSVDTARHTIDVKLNTPDVVRDGKLTVKYQTNQNARLMIFAVNDGILQVARVTAPRPIAYFFKKAALQVETYQILSLILPEYKILSEFAKTGGGDYNDADAGAGIFTNPFARRTDAPVAMYSGIIETQKDKPGEITFDIPENFNGSIRVYAVAASDSGAGAADKTVTVQSPVIITMNAPNAVAPNDEFVVNAVVTNLTDDKSPAQFNITAQTDGPVTIDNNTKTAASIAPGAEYAWAIPTIAAPRPGAAEIRTTAKSGSVSATAHATISVRPATPYITDIQSGLIDNTEKRVRIPDMKLYPDIATRKLYVSANADAMVRPLVQYLANYEWDCTEQLISRAMPYALNASAQNAAEKIEKTVSALKNRQNDDGSFGMWTGGTITRNNESDAMTAYLTAYVAQFLTIAHENGFDTGGDMRANAVNYLRTYAGTQIRDVDAGLAHAFAIYVITANEYVTTSYINLFEEWANENAREWESGPMGTYVAAAYKMMHQDDRGMQIIEKYNSKHHAQTNIPFVTPIASNAIHQYIATKYFGMTADAAPRELIEYINAGNYTSIDAAALIMGQYGNTNAESANTPGAVTVTANNTEIRGTTTDGNMVFDIPMALDKITIKCPQCDNAPMYWSVEQSGYPMNVSATSDGIEIVREYYDMDGNRITSAKIGDRVRVKIFARATRTTANVSNAVIVDLMPGGFVTTSDEISGEYEHAEMREDRVLIFTDITRNAREYSYVAQMGTAGTFEIPPIFGQSMYNAGVRSIGRGGTFTVTNDTGK